jgi:O-antigen ligase
VALPRPAAAVPAPQGDRPLARGGGAVRPRSQGGRAGDAVQERRLQLTASALPVAAAGARAGAAILFAVVFALAALLAYLSPLGLAPLVGLAGVACIGAPRSPVSRTGLIGLGALFVWAGASLVWSPARPWLKTSSLVSAIEHVTLLELALFAVLAALAVRTALRLEPSQARTPAAALRWSVLGLAVVLAVESAEGGQGDGALARLLQPDESADLVRVYTARGGYVLAVLMWPWLCILAGRARWLAPTPFLAVAAVSLLLRQDAPFAALLAGSAAFALVFTAGRWGLAVLGAAHAGFWLGAPWAVRLAERAVDFDRLNGAIKGSWSVRLGIWRFAADRIAEHPWRGSGMDAARAFGEAIPLHTHDWPLQAWLELGLPGVVLIAGLWLGLLRRAAGQPDRFRRAAAAAGMTAYLAIGAVSFGLWQPWWLAVGVLAVLGAIVAARAYRSGGA